MYNAGQRRISGPSSFWGACDLSCTHTTGAASAVPLAFMPFDILQTTCILTTCGCSGMLAMYRRRDDQRESLDWQSRGQAFGARALNPIECGPLPANVSFLSVLDDKTSQMLFVLWRQVALVKGHFSERIASCVKKRLSSPLLKCIPQTTPHGAIARLGSQVGVPYAGLFNRAPRGRLGCLGRERK